MVRKNSMFGPNTYFEDNVNISYSHRDKQFFELFDKTRELFSEIFQLKDYDILFILGGGTTGVESLFYSCKRKINLIGVNGFFKDRWEKMSKNYYKSSNKSPFEMYCRLETSCSTAYEKQGCFIDAVSAFPYYSIPKDTLGFVTCLNKQLGSYIGLAVVGIRKDMWDEFVDEDEISYLNLARYKKYHLISQTPFTTPTYIYEHFYKVLCEFNIDKFKDRLDQVSDMIVNTIGKENIIGELRGPVITFKKDSIPEEFARKYNIYGYWAKRPHYQIFTYTDKVENYKKVMIELNRYRNGK